MNTFTLAIFATLFATTAALATPSLKGDITVNAAIVTVGDMFDGAGELSETAIFRAPAPGTTGIVALADVQQAVKSIGIASFDNVGFTRVRVVRATTIIDAAVLDRLIGDNLAARGSLAEGVTPEVHYDLANVSFNAEAVTDPAHLTDLRFTPENGAFTARFSIAGIDQPVDLTGNIQLMTTAPRLIETLPAGSVLVRSDFELASVPVSTADAGAFAAIDQLIGKQLVRQSRVGLMLKASDVTEPTVITRNSLVTVLLKVGAMTLTVKGQALNTVPAGAPVDVLNTATRKVLHGIALPDGTVSISSTIVASL